MRQHGVPNFPDPTFPSGGGARVAIEQGVDINSPAFQSASRTCGGPGPGRRQAVPIGSGPAGPKQGG